MFMDLPCRALCMYKFQALQGKSMKTGHSSDYLNLNIYKATKNANLILLRKPNGTLKR